MAYNTGATFYPGGDDSYYMPEVVSPQPQRVAEAPVNMQENVAQMEHQASWRSPQNGVPAWNPPPTIAHHETLDHNYGHTNIANSQAYQQPQFQGLKESVEQPNFSPFPQLRNRGSNVPPSDDEREATLEAAREAVLSSNDFETQLTWAQDALAYVETAVQNETNVAVTQGARSRTPRIEHMLREDALRVVEFLADQHHPRAEFIKGTWLEFGKFGHRTDKREAYNCYTRASERGYARAYYRIGMQFENSNEALKAIKYYQLGVESGDAASCYRLGMMTLLGQHGQQKDYNRGLYLIQTSAQKADDNAPQGAYVLGMLQSGELAQVSIPESTLPRDLYNAKLNIEKAAFLGFARAQVRMGQAYELGDLNCQFDPVLSLHYNALAARQGEAEAEMAISKWFLCGQEGLFEKNEEMAFTYAQRAAVAGLATAQFAMGYFYEVGIYVSVDLKQAREWYQKADENGNADARKRISEVSRSKTISRKDHESIAVQRIRSQRASADRLPTLPSLQEFSTTPHLSEKPQSPTLTMPDPSRMSLNSMSTPQRPTSTAPYPIGNSNLNTPSPNIRPTSAFGINPRLQQQTAQSNRYPTGPRPDGQRLNSGPQGYPSNGMGPPGQGYRPDDRRPAVPQGYASQQRLPNHQGPPRPSTTSPYMGPQGEPGPNNRPPATPQPQQSNQRPLQTPKSPQGADIGFSAPPDIRPERIDSRRPLPSQQQRPQKAPGPAPGPSPGYQSPQPQPQPQQSSSRPQPQQQSHNKPHPNPQTQSPKITPAQLVPSKPIAAPPTPKPDSQKPPTVLAATAATRPPGKGPKTFEEMGVPQAKKESDCIVM